MKLYSYFLSVQDMTCFNFGVVGLLFYEIFCALCVEIDLVSQVLITLSL